MHLKPYPKFQKELKLESNADGMCDGADGQMDIWAIIKPGNTKEKIGIFAGQQCGQSSAPANLSTEGIRADVGLANPRTVSMKAKGCWEVEGSTATRRKRSTEPDKSCCPEQLPQGGRGAQQEAGEREGEGKTLSVVEIVAYIEQRANKLLVDCTKPLLPHSSGPATTSRVGSLHPALCPEERSERPEMLEGREEEGERMRVPDMVAKLELECLKGQSEKECSSSSGLLRNKGLRRSVCRVLLPGPGSEVGSGPAPPQPEPIDRESRAIEQYHESMPSPSAESTGTYRGETEGSESVAKPCVQVDAKEQGEEVSRGGSSHAEHREERLPGMQFFFLQQEQQPASTASQNGHPAAPQYDREEDPGSKEDVEEQEEEVVLELDVLPLPAEEKKEKRKRGAHQEETQGLESAAKPCMQVDAKEQDEEVSRGGSSHAEHREEPLLGMQFFFSQQEQQPASTASQDGHPAAPWYDREEDPGSKEDVEEREEEVVLELDVLPRPAQKKKKKRKRGAHQEETEGSESAAKPCMQVDAKEQDEELKLESNADGMCDEADGHWAVIKPGNTKKKIGIFTGQQCGQFSAPANLITEGIRAEVGPANPRMVSMKAKGCWEVEGSTATRRKRSTEPDKRCCPERLPQGGRGAQREAGEGEGEGKTLSVVEIVAYIEQRANKPQVGCTKPLLPRSSGPATTSWVGSLHPALCPEERPERPEALEGREEEGERMRVLDIVAKLELECLKRQSEKECSSSNGLSRNKSLRRSVCRVLLPGPGSEVGSGPAPPQPEPIDRESRAVEQYHESMSSPSAESRGAYRGETEGSESAAKPCMQVDAKEQDEEMSRGGSSHAEHREEPLPGMQFFFSEQEQQPASTASQDGHPAAPRYDREEDPGSKEDVEEREEEVVLELDVLPRPAQKKKKKRKRGAHQEEPKGSESAAKPCMQVDVKEQDEEVSRGGSSHAEHREEPLPEMQFFFSQQEQQPASMASQDGHPAAPRCDREEDPGSKEDVEELEEEVALELDVLPRPAQKKKKKRKRGAHQEETEGSESAAKPCMQVDAKEQDEELKLESNADGMCNEADGHRAVIKPGNTKKMIGIFTGQQCGRSCAPANLSTEGIRADVGPANPRMVSMKAKGCWEVEGSTAMRRKCSADPDKRFSTMHLKPYPKFQKELKLESNADGMCDGADGQMDIWAIIKPGNTKEKIGIFAGQQCGQSSAPANLSTEGIRADVGLANPRTVSMKAKGCWEVEGSTATRMKRSTEPDKRCCPERLPQGGRGAQREAREGEGEGKTLSVVEIVAYIEQRANKPQVDCTKPLLPHSSGPATTSRVGSLHPALCPEERPERPEALEGREEEGERMRVLDMVAKLELECLKGQSEKECSSSSGLSRNKSLRRSVCRVLLPGPGSEVGSGPAPPQPEPIDRESRAVEQYHESMPSPSAESRGAYQGETEGSESAAKPCVQVDAKEQDEEVSRGGSSHAEHREEPLPGMQFFFLQQEQQPASTASQNGHPAAPWYDREEDPGSKEDVEEREEEVVLELDVLPRPAQKKKKKRKRGAHQEETEGSESAAKPCTQVDAKERDEEVSRGGSSHAEHREEPLPGMQFFFLQQEQQPASTASQDGHPAAPRYDREEVPGSEEDVEEQEEEVVLELDVLPRPAQKKKKKRKKSLF